MAYDINAALERLENNLAEVESAKNQVEETIATSESLQQIIGRYTATLNSMGKDICKRIRDAAFFFIIMLFTFAATLLKPQNYVSSRTIQKCVEHVSTST